MELNARYDLKRLATAESDDGLDRLELNELRFSDDYWGPFQNNRFFMVRRVSECDDMRYDLIFNDVRTAAAEFGKRFCVKTGDGRKFFLSAGWFSGPMIGSMSGTNCSHTASTKKRTTGPRTHGMLPG